MERHLQGVHLPLSDGSRYRPRARVRTYYDWSPVLANIVGIHVHGSWSLALRLQEKALDVELRRDPANEHDPNAVGAYVDGKQIGYLMKEAAADIAPALERGMPLVARAAGEPVGCTNSIGWEPESRRRVPEVAVASAFFVSWRLLWSCRRCTSSSAVCSRSWCC